MGCRLRNFLVVIASIVVLCLPYAIARVAVFATDLIPECKLAQELIPLSFIGLGITLWSLCYAMGMRLRFCRVIKKYP